MKSLFTALCVTTVAMPVSAQIARDMDAHEHGVTTLEIAIQGEVLEVHLAAPGMDLVGFEHEASTDADLAAVEDAVHLLSDPKNVLTLHDAAGCQATESAANLAGDHHAETEHEHETEHVEEAEHTEFTAQYGFTCTDPDALKEMSFPYFKTFEHAHEIDVVYITDQGAGTATATRDAARISLK